MRASWPCCWPAEGVWSCQPRRCIACWAARPGAGHDRHRQALGRFEREQPNQLWQMDFKSPKGWDQPVGPLSVIDDRSRYAVTLHQTGSTRAEAVREQLEQAFTRCGVPQAMLMDHGTPWWNAASAGGWTQLTCMV